MSEDKKPEKIRIDEILEEGGDTSAGLGEIEVLDPGAGRMATITAVTETTCIAVTRAELLEGLAADPAAAIALLEILAGRFREGA